MIESLLNIKFRTMLIGLFIFGAVFGTLLAINYH